ncbi:MAG: hypothetical protein KF841_07835 [Phycisphaerae bacterium]|nr:hypothetical protein [Phycisphaerae bacterium]
MAHQVSFEIPKCPVGVADIVFSVQRNGKQFGRLRVSKGAVVWVPTGKSKGHRVSWTQIDEFAKEKGDPVHVGF